MSRRLVMLTLLLAALATTACVVAYERPRPVAPSPPPQAPPPRPNVGWTVSIFYDNLDPYGDWVWHDPYGWVWMPQRVSMSWRPYTEGQWVLTDDGWTWVSDEPWGWAVYHYGRWAWVPRYGWAWVPGREWAPAWVAWRSGGGHIGWAPLPPEVSWRAGFGLDLGNVNIDVVVRPEWWCFVDEPRFLEPQVARYAAAPGHNVTLVRDTRFVTRYDSVDRRIVNRSIRVDQIERATRRPVPRVQVVDARSPDEVGRQREAGGQVRFFRPDVGDDRDAAPRRPVGRAAGPRRASPSGSPVRAERAEPIRSTPAASVPSAAPPPAAAPRTDDRRREAGPQTERGPQGRGRPEPVPRDEERRVPPGRTPDAMKKGHEGESKAPEPEARPPKEVQKEAQEEKAGSQGAKPEDRPKAGSVKGEKPRKAKDTREKEKEKEKENPEKRDD